MSIIDNFKKVVFEHYADFGGRARRQEFWYFFLANIILQMIFAIPAMVLIQISAYDGGSVSVLGIILYVISILLSLAILLPSISLAVRRLHDTGRSGWYYFMAFIPLIGGLIVLYFFAQDSQPGVNKWGPNPKENADIDTLGRGYLQRDASHHDSGITDHTRNNY